MCYSGRWKVLFAPPSFSEVIIFRGKIFSRRAREFGSSITFTNPLFFLIGRIANKCPPPAFERDFPGLYAPFPWLNIMRVAAFIGTPLKPSTQTHNDPPVSTIFLSRAIFPATPPPPVTIRLILQSKRTIMKVSIF